MCCRKRLQTPSHSASVPASSEGPYNVSPKEPLYSPPPYHAPPQEPSYGLALPAYQDVAHLSSTNYQLLLNQPHTNTAFASVPSPLAPNSQLDTAATRLLALKHQGTWLGHDADLLERDLLKRSFQRQLPASPAVGRQPETKAQWLGMQMPSAGEMSEGSWKERWRGGERREWASEARSGPWEGKRSGYWRGD